MSGMQVRTFPHRKNWDGTYDSICKTCFRTIARAKREEDLAAAEQLYVCESTPALLEAVPS